MGLVFGHVHAIIFLTPLLLLFAYGPMVWAQEAEKDALYSCKQKSTESEWRACVKSQCGGKGKQAVDGGVDCPGPLACYGVCRNTIDESGKVQCCVEIVDKNGLCFVTTGGKMVCTESKEDAWVGKMSDELKERLFTGNNIVTDPYGIILQKDSHEPDLPPGGQRTVRLPASVSQDILDGFSDRLHALARDAENKGVTLSDITFEKLGIMGVSTLEDWQFQNREEHDFVPYMPPSVAFESSVDDAGTSIVHTYTPTYTLPEWDQNPMKWADKSRPISEGQTFPYLNPQSSPANSEPSGFVVGLKDFLGNYLFRWPSWPRRLGEYFGILEVPNTPEQISI